MNSLFTCSWQKNIQPVNEQTWVDAVSKLLTEAAEDQSEMDLGDTPMSKTPGKRGKPADPRYARLMGLGSVRELAGTMTPRYFATKVIRQLEAEHPDKKIEDITDEQLLQAMNLVSNLSRKLATKPEIKFSTQKIADEPKSEEKLKRGKDAFETLKLNLEPGTELKFQEDLPSGYGIYTGEKDGLKYRITLKEFDGKPMKVSEIAKDNIASLIVTDPKVKQRSDPFQVEGDIDLPGPSREKPIADFPSEGEGDFSGPELDPEDVYATTEKEVEAPKRTRKSKASAEKEDEKEDEGDADEKEPGAEDVSAAEADEPEFTATQAAEKKKNYWERLKKENPELYKKAWAKRSGAVEDDDVEPEPEKVEAPEDTDEDKEEEDNEDMDVLKNPTIIIVHKKSPQALQKEMMEQIRLKNQNKLRHERRNTLGY